MTSYPVRCRLLVKWAEDPRLWQEVWTLAEHTPLVGGRQVFTCVTANRVIRDVIIGLPDLESHVVWPEGERLPVGPRKMVRSPSWKRN